MTDEMVSALRLTTPVTEETLEMVAEHVKNSLPRDNWASVLDHVYLKFVYGPEQSLTHFIEVRLIVCDFCAWISLDLLCRSLNA